MKTLRLSYLLFLTLSFAGLILTATLIKSDLTSPDGFLGRQILVGGIFISICILGILAGCWPSRCFSIINFQRKRSGEFAKASDVNSILEKPLRLKGHHPDCIEFQDHVVSIHNRTLCAGCVGLVLGALLSIFGSTVYFFGGFSFCPIPQLTFWIGFLWVCCGLLQYSISILGRGFIHLSVNVLFVLGVFLLLVSLDEMRQSTIFDLYFLTLTLFLIYTRILFSQLDHKKTCSACSLGECVREEKVEVLESASHSEESTYHDKQSEDDDNKWP